MHFHDFVGVMQLQPVTKFPGCREQRTQRVLTPNQNGSAIRIPTEEIDDGRNGDRRTVVTTHAVDGKCDRHRENGRVPKHPAAFGSTNYSPLALTTFLPR